MTNLTKTISQGAMLIALTAVAVAPAAAETRVNSACAAQNADAVMTSTIPADMPPFALIAGLSGSSVVQFDLDGRGNPHNVAIFASSGSRDLDGAARKAALDQTYSPQIRNCVGVSGTYRVVVVFDRSDAR